MEIWKDIPNYEGLYQVSNIGRIKSIRFNKEKIMKLKNKNGYLSVSLSDKYGKQKYFQVHRLVALVFVEGYQEGLQVNHINEIRDDNRAENLEWCTAKYNSNYGNHNKKVSQSKQKKIYCVELDKVFESITQASEELGCSISAISNCLRGRNEKSMGYHWEYID